MKTESEEKDWVKVLYEVILKILTLRFPHCNSSSYIGDPSERVKELKN